MIRKYKIGILEFDFFFIRLFLFCALFYSQNIFSQQNNKQIKEIDSLIEVSNQVYMRYEFLSLIPLSQNILKKSREINYEKGLVYGYFYVASALGGIGKYKESNHYVQKSQDYKKYLAKDHMQSSRNFGLLGDNYLSLELYSLCRENYQKTINELKKAKRDRTIIRTESSTYVTLGLLYSQMKKSDSTYYYLIKAKNLIKNLEGADLEIEKNIIEVDLGSYHLDYKNLDSAKYYFNNAIRKSTLNVPVKIYAYKGLGDLYHKRKNYLEAEKNYLKVIDIVQKSKYPIEDFEVYKSLSQIYMLLGNSEKSEKFLKLFDKNQDSLDLAKKIERDIIINDILKIEKENLVQQNRNVTGIYIFLAGFMIILIVIYLNYRNKKILKEKENIVSIKEDENKELKQKLNEAFDEIINLAKTNNPFFWTRFQEVYPNFKDNFLAVNPDLKVADLTFCAYVYLGFSSKEIADYTFKALKTVENYRYNIRKKLSLLPDQDFGMAIKDIANRKSL